jgi:tetraacyldisaccharide 4'-kinase
MKRPWLFPFVPLYAAGVALRGLRLRSGLEPVRRLRWPVVSIGNLSTGGAGKTPLTIALAKLLTARGFHVDVLSRGYGRRSALPLAVKPNGTAEDFGDEPLLISCEAGVPVYVGAKRYEAGLLAESDWKASRQLDTRQSQFPIAHILDDGFQHRQLARDLDILLLNRADWCDSLLPAGNLRETLSAARRATLIAIPAEEPEFEQGLRRWGWEGPIWQLHRRMEAPSVDGPVAAFCGIARPEQFFAGLEAAGLRVAERKAFPDHYDYTDPVVEWLAQRARAVGASALVTTEKDAVRLGDLLAAFPADLPVKTARLRTEIEDEASAIDSLVGRLRDAQPDPSL